MAQLPGYRQKLIGRAAAAGAAPMDMNAARTTQAIGAAASDARQAYLQMQEREARDYQMNSQNQTTIALADEKIKLTNEAKTGSEYSDGIKNFIEAQKQIALDSAPSNVASKKVSDYYDGLLASQMQTAIPVAARINAENTASVTEQTLKLSFNDTFQNPENYEQQLGSGLQIIDTSDIPESKKYDAFRAYTNELTVYRFQGTIKTDPVTAKRELESGDWNAILTTDQLMRLTNAADQQIKATSAASKTKVSKQIKDYIAYKSAGGQDVREFNEEQLKTIYGDEAGAELFSQIKDVDRFARNFGEVELASAEDLPSIIERETVKGPEDYTTQAGQQNVMLRAVNERNKQLSNDPALYAMKSGNVQDAFESFQSSGDGSNYAVTTISEQQRLGVPGEFISVFSKPQAKAIIAQYNEGGETAMEMVTTLKEQFGDYFPVVMRDLNRAGLSPHASMVSVLESGPATYLSQADKAGYKVMKENVGADDYKTITTETKNYVDDRFTDTLNGTPAGIATRNQVTKSTELLAMYYLDSGMVDNPSDAAEKAYEDVIASRYTFQDTYRVPTKVGDYQPDALKVEAALDSLLDGVRDLDLMAPYDPNLPMEQAQEVYKLRLLPKWQTRGDDAGVELVDQNQQAVLTADGEKLFYTWSELEEMDMRGSVNFLGLRGL